MSDVQDLNGSLEVLSTVDTEKFLLSVAHQKERLIDRSVMHVVNVSLSGYLGNTGQ